MYHVEHNLKGRLHFPRHHAASYEVEFNQQGQMVSHKEKAGLQDFYNGFAAVGGFILAWGTIGLIVYHLAKPYIQMLFGGSLL